MYFTFFPSGLGTRLWASVWPCPAHFILKCCWPDLFDVSMLTNIQSDKQGPDQSLSDTAAVLQTPFKLLFRWRSCQNTFNFFIRWRVYQQFRNKSSKKKIELRFYQNAFIVVFPSAALKRYFSCISALQSSTFIGIEHKWVYNVGWKILSSWLRMHYQAKHHFYTNVIPFINYPFAYKFLFLIFSTCMHFFWQKKKLYIN